MNKKYLFSFFIMVCIAPHDIDAKKKSLFARVARKFRDNMRPYMSEYNIHNWNNVIEDAEFDPDDPRAASQRQNRNNQNNSSDPFSSHRDNGLDEEDDIPDFTFADIAGTVPQDIIDLLDLIQNTDKFARFGINPPRGILLVGPPGTGKTSLARAIAGQAQCGFIHSSASEFIEIYVGTGPLRVRQLFERARAYRYRNPDKKAIIFIDDIDAIGSRFAMAGHDTESRRTLNELLNQMDGFKQDENIIVLAATNNVDDIDPALKRAGRFDTIADVPLPHKANRKAVLQHYINKLPRGCISRAVDINTLAEKTYGCNNADLKELVRMAAVNAAREDSSMIMQQHLDLAVKNILHQKRY